MAGQHEAARPKGAQASEEPTREPMRPAPGTVRRNPSTDQKKARRRIQREADWTPGHVECKNCGNVGHPTLGDGTAPSCSTCGSYNIKSTRPRTPEDNSRYLTQGDYARQASHYSNEKHDRCDFCGIENDTVKNGLCPRHEYLRDDEAGDDDEISGHSHDLFHQRSAAAHPSNHRVATVLKVRAEMLNQGDMIRLPNGKTQKVSRQPRPHETSQHHVYVDTDGGTALAKRQDLFEVVPQNSMQQSLPGYGTPDGNTNSLPFGGGGQDHGTNKAPSNKCPNCGAVGTMVRRGDHYTCSRCGYSESFNGASGPTFSDSPRQVRTFSTINGSTMSAVARRAAAVLNQEENQ